MVFAVSVSRLSRLFWDSGLSEIWMGFFAFILGNAGGGYPGLCIHPWKPELVFRLCERSVSSWNLFVLERKEAEDNNFYRDVCVAKLLLHSNHEYQ